MAALAVGLLVCFAGGRSETVDTDGGVSAEVPYEESSATESTEVSEADIDAEVVVGGVLQSGVCPIEVTGENGDAMTDEDDYYIYTSLDGVTLTTDVTEIYFLDTLTEAPEEAADISQGKDHSVLCWTEGTVQYIAGDGGVIAGSSCACLFQGYTDVTAIHFDGNFDTSGVTDMFDMFYDCAALTNLNLSGFDTSNVTDMSWMFSGCAALTTLNLSGFDTSKVTDMSGMFSSCESLTKLDLSGWDTSSVTNINRMFMYCFDLQSLDLSSWDTSNVTDMSQLFCCASLTSLDLSNWNTANVTDMSYMFFGCSSLNSLDLSGWDTSNVTDMEHMFGGGCSALTSLNLSGWNTSNVTDMYCMFDSCSALTDFDPSWLDTSNANTTDMYTGTRWE
ncbi:MAG: DUF285 domain-containing protein [Clostridiales bacterium]|nr:DUF285 domain-containing protein [Clostridiales bacterium]